MMKHHLTFKDDKSDKFWQIETNGNSFTVTYGKTGTAGTSQTKNFDNDEKCLKEVEKLLNEKLKKGYLSTSDEINPEKHLSLKNKPSFNNYYEDWMAIISALDNHKALVDHFSYLLDTPGLEKKLALILQEVMSRAQEVSCDKEGLKINFSKFQLIATSPAKSIKPTYPDSFKEILIRHKTVTTSNYWTTLGEHGGFDIKDGWFDEIEDETDPTFLTFAKAAKLLISPMDDGSSGNHWLYHPSEKNASGEPVIYYIEHDGMEIKWPQPLNVGSLFLTQVAEFLDIPSQAIIDNDPEVWWSSLDSHWKKIFTNYGIEDSSQVIKAMSLQDLTIGKESEIESLAPIISLTKLKKLIIHAPQIDDISPIGSLTQLEELSILNKSSIDISPISNLRKLRKLDLSGSHIKNLKSLKETFLRSLKLNNTNLKNVDELSNLNYHNLYHLELANTEVKYLTPLERLKNIKLLNISNTLVESLDSLTYWSLDKIELDKTLVSSLKPLDSHLLSYVSFYETPVSLDEALRFKATTPWWCQINCNFTKNELFNSVKKDNTFDSPDLKSILGKWINKIINQIEEGRWSFSGAYEIENELWNPAEDEKQAKKLLSEYQPSQGIITSSEILKRLESIPKQLEYKKEVIHANSPDHWINSIKHLPFFGNNGFVKKAEWEINKSLTRAVAADYIKDGKKLWLAYLKTYPFLVKENLSVFKNGIDIRQNIAANGILLSLRDEKSLDLVKPLIPKTITEPSLANSLARLYEVKKEREKMLESIKLAIYLCYDKSKFLEDRNFKAYKGDLDFLAATNTNSYETLFTQYCERLEIEKLLPLILDLPTFRGKPVVEILVSILYNAFIKLIENKKLTEAKSILKNYLSVIPEIGHSNHVGTGLKTSTKFNLREAYASNTIILAILLKDEEVTEMAHQLIPENITDTTLAYNLACFHSLKRDKEEMLRYIKLAIVLGKKKDQFIADSDFDHYKNDSDFLAALE